MNKQFGPMPPTNQELEELLKDIRPMHTDDIKEELEEKWRDEQRIVNEKTGAEKGVKPERYDLIPWGAFDEIARVFARGAIKYEVHNWAKGYDYSLSIGALFRHVSLFSQGQDLDDETGLQHMAHAAFHCLALIHYLQNGVGNDDRLKTYGSSKTEEA